MNSVWKGNEDFKRVLRIRRRGELKQFMLFFICVEINDFNSIAHQFLEVLEDKAKHIELVKLRVNHDFAFSYEDSN